MGCYLIVQEFCRLSFSGYILNVVQDNFYYMYLSRNHPQRIQATKRLSETTTTSPQDNDRTRIEPLMLESEPESGNNKEVRYFISFLITIGLGLD